MIDGYNQKITVLLEAVLERMIHLKIDSQRFEILKTKVRLSSLDETHSSILEKTIIAQFSSSNTLHDG